MEKEINSTAEKVKVQMRKGTLEFSVLLIISEGKAYASSIISDLKKANLIVVEGTLYPLLGRLKRNGLLEYVWEESKSGPPRKYYSLTDDGRKTLNNLIGTWKKLSASIVTLINHYEKSN